MTRSRVKNDFAVGIDDTATATAITIDSSKNVGIGTETPDSKLVVHGVNGSASRIHISSGSAGQQTFTGSGSGLLLTAQNMNTTSKFTPAIQFGSKDVDFTTTNPKVGAAINGIASQTYSTDDRGGMDLAFYTTPNTPGTGQTTTERMRILAEGGLTFNGDTATANALDDYEEGSWDCHLRDTATGNIVVSDGATNGRYVKIGRQITVYVLLYANGVSSYTFSGSPYFALPVATANHGGGGCSALDVRYLLNLSTVETAYNEQNSTRLLLANSVASPANNVASGITISGNVRLYGCISYQTA